MYSRLSLDNQQWPVARFPSYSTRKDFLEQVRSWNRVEGLPTIMTQLMCDGREVRFWSGEDEQSGVRKLIGSYGGRIREAARSGSPEIRYESRSRPRWRR